MILTKEQVDGAYSRALDRVIRNVGVLDGVHPLTYECHHTFRYVFAEEIVRLVSCNSPKEHNSDQSN